MFPEGINHASSANWSWDWSLFVAAVAVAFTFWGLWLQRRHNRLSVTPHLGFHWNSPPGEPSTLILRNNGLGPAVLTKYSVVHSGHEYDGGSNTEIWKLMRKAPIEGEAVNIESGEALSEKHSLTLFKFDPQSEVERRAVREFLVALTVKVSFESFYGEKDEITESCVEILKPQ